MTWQAPWDRVEWRVWFNPENLKKGFISFPKVMAVVMMTTYIIRSIQRVRKTSSRAKGHGYDA
jgi:hypothetical protein